MNEPAQARAGACVSARTSDAGRLLFISTRRHPVITRGSPTSRVEVIIDPVPYAVGVRAQEPSLALEPSTVTVSPTFWGAGSGVGSGIGRRRPRRRAFG